MKILLIICLIICHTVVVFSQTTMTIKTVGTIDKMLNEADLSIKVNLDTLKTENLFALGVVDSLKGNICVINGKPLTAFINNTFVNADTTFKHQATLLVYTYVTNWTEVSLEQDFNDQHQLATFIAKIAAQQGIDTTKAFPFMIKTWAKNVSYQVIDWRSDFVHTADTHQQFAHQLWHSGETLLLAGFYSTNHEGIFTEKKAKLWTYVVAANPLRCGQLDVLQTFGKMAIYLPDYKNIKKPLSIDVLKLSQY